MIAYVKAAVACFAWNWDSAISYGQEAEAAEMRILFTLEAMIRKTYSDNFKC